MLATKEAFGYDSSSKGLNEFRGIVITTEDPAARTSDNTKGPKAFSHLISLASANIITKATLMMIAVVFLYFC